MARTTAQDVIDLLTPGGDYDTNGAPSLTPFIATANVIVTRVAACATVKGLTLTAAELELVERWLAAHYYTKSDPTYSSRSTEGASGQFVRDPQEPEPYKATAINLDYSGCLSAILKRQFGQMLWLGKRPSEQTEYTARD